MPTKKPAIPMLSQSEFITEVAKSQSTTKTAVYNAIKLLKLGATDVLKQHKSFRLFEFALFNIVERGARTVRNPQTGEKLTIPKQFEASVRLSRKLKNAVKGVPETKQETKKPKSK